MKFRAVHIVILLCAILATNADTQEDSTPMLTGPYLGQDPPGNTPTLFAPGIVSTSKEHSAAMFAPDGKELWFGRMFPAKIHYMKLIDGKWTEPQVATFCDTFKYLYPVLTHDGTRIFFSSDRPIEMDGKRLNRGEVDIWMVVRTSAVWSEPSHLDNNVNFDRRNSCGSVAANGNLYFTGTTDDKATEMFCSEPDGDVYINRRHLTAIDSPVPDHCPFVAPDESYMIFSSFRSGLGRSDLFISFRKQDGTWSEPTNMGPAINSAYKDEYPYITPDGRYLFFNSNRPSSINKRPIPDGPRIPSPMAALGANCEVTSRR
ncbi:MAG: PD40 domain-containing protein [Candidatus Zixiibacteriota bacterium]|nr:MAG: PD40 domain-containing protein [candidate division Zixibacteria bacterium]